ncbi:MAG: YafY family transcriptional regulator [Spirochaetaceae bacterium]|nr:MAG: YafY family transcriptional regulator [Spirochaetaceae bacterium]
MKVDRLLSIIVYLLNRELVSARELAERYGVSVRTIQRDMEAIDLAGIPIMSVQGPHGGYGIIDSYKLDRQFVTVDDLFYIITSLSSIGSSLTNQKISATTEKMKSLISGRDERLLAEKHQKLFADFSMLSGPSRQPELLRAVERAVDENRLLQIEYTNNKLESSERIVEPMTLAFKWRSWYLYAYCRFKSDYRLFRLSRIRNPKILPQRFRRREKSIEEYLAHKEKWSSGTTVDLVLAFDPKMRSLVEEYFAGEKSEEDERGRLVVRTTMPEDGWVYGMILSYGNLVEVLSPERVRRVICDLAAQIHKKYAKS